MISAGIFQTLKKLFRAVLWEWIVVLRNMQKENGIKMTVFLPQYERYGRVAPIIRNKEIVDYADKIIAFWNGSSKGTLSVIKYAEKTGKPCEIVICK